MSNEMKEAVKFMVLWFGGIFSTLVLIHVVHGWIGFGVVFGIVLAAWFIVAVIDKERTDG